MTPLMPVIKRCTASRLGLRTPYMRPRGLLLRWNSALTDAQMVELMARFEAANQARYRTVLLS